MISRNLITGLCAAGLGLGAHASLTTDLVVYYDFEDLGNDPAASGPDATESGTGSYTGVTGGVAGNAAEFTGTTDDFINTAIGFGGAGGDELSNSFTVSAWYNLDTDASSGQNRFFVLEEASDYDVSYGVRSLSPANGFNDTQTYTNGSGSADVFRNHLDVHVPGTWQHVAITYESDGTDTTIRTYIDGELASTMVEATAELTGSAFHIGNARTGSLSRAFDGKIDEFAAWSRVLSPTEIIGLRERGAAGLGVTEDLGALNKFVLAVATSDPEWGGVTGSGIYDLNATPPVSATALPGYVFSQWTDDFAGQPDSFAPTVTTDLSGIAEFVPDDGDDDGDGLTNFEEETIYFTRADLADTDGDLIKDGDEVNTTNTNPNISDDLAVDYILANLCTGGAGPDDIVLTRDGGTDSVTVKIKAEESGNLSTWDPVVPADATSSGVSGDELEVVLPDSGDPTRFFHLEGGDPAPAP